jgi:hypothetical protein
MTSTEPAPNTGMIPIDVLILFARADGRRACEADVPIDQNPYRGRDDYLASVWEDSWLDTVVMLVDTGHFD